MKLIRDQGLRWPDIQRVLGDDRRSRSGRRGTGCVAGDVRGHCGDEVTRSARVATNQHYYQGDRGILGNLEPWDQRTQAHRPNRFTGRDFGVCAVEVREISGRSAVSPVIPVRARSRDTFVSRAASAAAIEETIVMASPALLASPTENVVTTYSGTS